MIVGDLELPDHYKRTLLTQRPSSKRAAKKRTDPYRRINVAPLAGILFALLVPFIGLPKDYHDLPTYAVVRPVSEHPAPMPGALREDAMQINLTENGRLFFDFDEIDLYRLQGQIRGGLQNGSERRVYLSVDARAKYSIVKKVLREVRLAGIENVSFLTN
jgi:biopolymer transport protein ExbD